MKKHASILAVCLGLALSLCALPGCGQDCGSVAICGSQCDLINCKFTSIKCQLYAPPNQSLVVSYFDELEGGQMMWTAKVFIDIAGLEPVAGSLLEGQDFMDRVALPSVGVEQWPDFYGKDCKINKGGAAGQDTAGQCNFAFDNGHFATFNFACQPEVIE